MENIAQTKKSGGSGAGHKQNPLDQSDHIYMIKSFQDQLLNNVVLRGVKGIKKVMLRVIKNTLVRSDGVYTKKDTWVLDTTGTNLLHMLGQDYIDAKRTVSNDIQEVYRVFGIEAARQAIYNELVEVFDCLEVSSSSLKCTFVAVFGFTGKSSPGGGLAAVTAPTAVLG